MAEAEITEEGLARIRARIGVDLVGRRPWRTVVDADSIYHLAMAIGDLNPNYVDEDYARAGRWGALIAPPTMVNSMDTVRSVGHAGMPEGLPGVHAIWAGQSYEFARPLRDGDRIVSRAYLQDVVERESSFAGGRAVYQTYEGVFHTREGEYVATRRDHWIRNERSSTRSASKYGATPLATWSPEEIEELLDEYDRHERTAHRKFAEVQVGDDLGSVLKGPLTGTAEIAFESYFGMYLVGNKPARDLHRRHPKLMVPNEQGVPEPPQRIHWDNGFAQRMLGLPGAYDLGMERASWLVQVVTDWMGDEGDLLSFDVQFRKFNYLGDVSRCRGEVSEVDDTERVVTCEVRCENHRGEITARGSAKVRLP
jgi:acyl dehydratase